MFYTSVSFRTIFSKNRLINIPRRKLKMFVLKASNTINLIKSFRKCGLLMGGHYKISQGWASRKREGEGVSCEWWQSGSSHSFKQCGNWEKFKKKICMTITFCTRQLGKKECQLKVNCKRSERFRPIPSTLLSFLHCSEEHLTPSKYYQTLPVSVQGYRTVLSQE